MENEERKIRYHTPTRVVACEGKINNVKTLLENKDDQIYLFDKDLEIKLYNTISAMDTEDFESPDTYDLLKKYHTKGVMHCYSDSAEMAKEFVKLGYYISISGTITFKNAKEPLRVIEQIPLDKLLIETDCPYLTPSPNRGKRNEPAYVIYTGKKICEYLNIDEESFKIQLNKNYHDCFGL